MPVVPFTQARPSEPSVEMPDQQYSMMAAAQMHSEGRLIKVDEFAKPAKDNPEVPAPPIDPLLPAAPSIT